MEGFGSSSHYSKIPGVGCMPSEDPSKLRRQNSKCAALHHPQEPGEFGTVLDSLAVMQWTWMRANATAQSVVTLLNISTFSEALLFLDP